MIRLKHILTEQSLPNWKPGTPGKLIKGDKNGKGTVEWGSEKFSGELRKVKYYGELRNGIPNGQGVLTHNLDSEGNKYYYKGSFKNGNEDGFGEYKWSPAGESYKGSFKNGHKDGFGEYKNNGRTYKGSFKNGWPDGYGETTYNSDGSSYKGSWKDGRFSGYGVYTSPAGLKFCGNWVENELDGKDEIYFDKMKSSPYTCDKSKKPQSKFTYTDPNNPFTLSDTDPWEYYLDADTNTWYTRRKGTTKWIDMMSKLPDEKMILALSRLNSYIKGKLFKKPGTIIHFNSDNVAKGERIMLFVYKNKNWERSGEYRLQQEPSDIQLKYLAMSTDKQRVLVQFINEPGKPTYWVAAKFVV